MRAETITSFTETPTELISTIIRHHLSLGQTFSLWKLPQSGEINLIVSNEAPIEIEELNVEESTPGFVIAPFHPLQKKIFLKASHRYLFKSNEVLKNGEPITSDELDFMKESGNAANVFHHKSSQMPKSASADSYLKLISEGINKIEEGLFEKIVPSRTKQIELPESFDEVKLFLKLIEKYPHALVSLVSSPETGTWMGATPELLVCTDRNQHFKTVALAGTQPYTTDTDVRKVAWTQKDIEEQALVCRYIISCFKKIRLREYIETGPKTVIAGNVLHLKTDYDVDMPATGFPQLGSLMLKLLHPTSAVCGMPLQPALDFLKENEGYNREFYSGFLGPVNIDNESHIYVNLRCMQILKDKKAQLYAGAGVTSDSIPEKEWEETEIKMNTLLNVING
jgi:isochorismate synthase